MSLGEYRNHHFVDDIIHALENFGDVMATGSQGEREEVIRGLVTQVVKSDDRAVIRYRLPDGKSARQKEVLDIVPRGGAGGIRTLCLPDHIGTLSRAKAMVELEGFEPSTSSMPLKRSPN